MKQKDTRREKGTGNIYQREPGKWIGRLRVGTKADGKPEVKYFSGKTEAEVKKKIREYNKALDPAQKEKVFVSEYIDNWLKPMMWQEFKEMPSDMQKEYIESLIQKFSVTASDLARMFGCRAVTGTKFCKSPEINIEFKAGKRMTAEQRVRFGEFSIQFSGVFDPEMLYNSIRHIIPPGTDVEIEVEAKINS